MNIPGDNAAHAAVLSDDGKLILLIRRRDLKVWVMPGGHLEKNETFRQAVIREVLEETGLVIKVKVLVGVYVNQVKKIQKQVFQAFVVGGTLQLSSESEAYGWFSVQKLPYPMTFYETMRINQAINYKGKVFRQQINISTKQEVFFQLKQNPIWFVYLLLNYFRLCIRKLVI